MKKPDIVDVAAQAAPQEYDIPRFVSGPAVLFYRGTEHHLDTGSPVPDGVPHEALNPTDWSGLPAVTHPEV